MAKPVLTLRFLRHLFNAAKAEFMRNLFNGSTRLVPATPTVASLHHFAGPCHLNIEQSNLLSQCIPV